MTRLSLTLTLTVAAVLLPVLARAQQIRDSAGAKVISYPAGARPPVEWHVDARPLLEFGGADGKGPLQFATIAGVIELADGRIVVANGGTNELRFFDKGGRFIKAAGRTGEGPGEFRYLSGLGVYRDTLLAFDYSMGGARYFTNDGKFVRQQLPPSGTGPVTRRPVAIFGNGVNVRVLNDDEGTMTPQFGFVVLGEVFLGEAPAGQRPKSLGRFPAMEAAPGPEAYGFPFGATTKLAVFPERICRGFGKEFALACYDPAGKLLTRTTWTRTATAVTPALQRLYDSAKAALNGGHKPGKESGGEGATSLKRTYARQLPLFGAFLAARTGELWVRDYIPEDAFIKARVGTFFAPSAATHWNVVGTDGRLVASVVLPARFTAFAVSTDHVLGVSRDDDDVERVTLLRLRKS